MEHSKDKDETKTPDKGEERAKEYLEGWKRERAAFENYKKEEYERMGEMRARTIRDFIIRLLPILDSFELALKNTPQEAQKSEWFTGYTYIKKQFEDFLREEGIEEIEGQGEGFNPRIHEAIDHEGDSEGSKLIVGEVLQKGYKINDYIIRPARVKVQKEGGENL